MHSVDGLSEAAKIAYQAYVDMSHSKAAHFSRLAAIEAMYESGGVPGTEEKQELESLLSSHDKNVLAFETAMAGVTDADEIKALLELMS
jgi:hypothetical protein